MSRKIQFILNGLIALAVQSISSGETQEEAEKRRQETQAKSIGYRHAINRLSDRYNHGIGSLVKLSYWSDVMPLTPDQQTLIWKLDRVVWDARVISFQVDAQYMAGNPVDYKDYSRRCRTRRSRARTSGRRMVMYGLLTKSQGSFVTYRNLTEQSMPYALQFDYYCDLLRMTEAQRHRLRWKTNDQILSSFTSEQQETWQRLTAKRSSTTLPDLTAPNPIDEVELSRVSPTFRTLSDTSIDWDFSDAQWKLLQDLKEVTWAGLQWGKDSQRFGPYPEGDSRNDPTDPAGQANEMFLKLAEDVAASGILTEPQEKRLEAADGK